MMVVRARFGGMPWPAYPITRRRPNMSTFHELSMQSITGATVRFEDYRGRHCLVVNVASR